MDRDTYFQRIMRAIDSHRGLPADDRVDALKEVQTEIEQRIEVAEGALDLARNKADHELDLTADVGRSIDDLVRGEDY